MQHESCCTRDGIALGEIFPAFVDLRSRVLIGHYTFSLMQGVNIHIELGSTGKLFFLEPARELHVVVLIGRKNGPITMLR